MIVFCSQEVMVAIFSLLAGAALFGNGMAQERPQPSPAPVVNSPEVLPGGRVVFRLLAPKAETVGLQATDIPGLPRGGPQFVKDERGVWEATVGPIEPGAYRYRFLVNGVEAIDPRNPSVSESNANSWSLFFVPGAEFMDTGKTPHGAVATVHYYSTALGRQRRMHVYTPPGYEMGSAKYPVFYLLHGAMDCDDSWTSVGRAGFIIDNLIAAKKAKAMIVVMPAGHTSATFSLGAAGSEGAARDEFAEDFVKDVMPYVETHYRVLLGLRNRAIAGLSMGGGQSLNIAFSAPPRFSYIGVFSSGVFSFAPRGPTAIGAAAPVAPMPSPEWEQQHIAVLGNEKFKKDLKLLWFATGSEDFLVNTTKATLEILKKHGFTPFYRESGGGHTWINWRKYLNEFAPQLFR
jgi:enterochelin esterase-like enzyme